MRVGAELLARASDRKQIIYRYHHFLKRRQSGDNDTNDCVKGLKGRVEGPLESPRSPPEAFDRTRSRPNGHVSNLNASLKDEIRRTTERYVREALSRVLPSYFQ